MKNFIKTDYRIHKVLAVIVPLAVLTFYFWLYLGPLCYLYVTLSDIVHLVTRKESIVSKIRLIHLSGGILYIFCFFVLPILYPEIMRSYIDRDYFMYIFWYGLPVCFFYLHYSFTRKDFLNVQQLDTPVKL